MLQQILIHTPLYVWGLLAVLVWRGVAALREREMAVRSLFVVPAIMLAMALGDVVTKFGSNTAALLAWAVAAAGAALLVWKFGAERTLPGAVPGSVRLRGSRAPLAMMLALFFTKYAASVLLAILPHARQDALFGAAVCLLFGLFNGYFLGRLARDLAAVRARQPADAAAA